MKMYDFEGKANICGERIKIARRKKGFTQNDFAAKLQLAGLNISQKIVSRIEKRERFLADFELKIISNILNVDVYELLGEDVPKE